MKKLLPFLLLTGCATHQSSLNFPPATKQRTAIQQAAPAPVTVTVGLRWNAVSNATGYKVYGSTNLMWPMPLFHTTANTNVVFYGMPSSYFFHVTATNQWGESK